MALDFTEITDLIGKISNVAAKVRTLEDGAPAGSTDFDKALIVAEGVIPDIILLIKTLRDDLKT